MPLINGEEYSHVHMKFSFLGNFNVVGVSSISWRRRTAKSNAYGAGGEPIARVRGKSEYEASIQFHSKEFFNLVRANGQRDIDDIPRFNLTISFANGVDPVKTVTLPNCEFSESGLSSDGGDELLQTEIPMILTKPIYEV